jgi:hypothetical protein
MLFDAMPIDRRFIPQDMLDLPGRERLSRLPWKGQFTPEFVDVMLDAYLPNGGAVLDPFAGSGTVLFEAAQRGLSGFGAEVNGAAVAFSRIAEMWNLTLPVRRAALRRAERLCDRWPERTGAQTALWDDGSLSTRPLIESASREPHVWRIVSAAVVLAQALRSQVVRSSVCEALARLEEIILEFPGTAAPCAVFEADARALPLADGAIDLVITSPPYINVHNYHQYARPAVELLGGSPLDAARSEIGANRKFRQNRFLTVVQYAIDMAQVLVELRRVVDADGRVVIVLGRESKVRGITFENGRLLAELVRAEGSFEMERRLERSFVNRFGGRIFEDIFELVPGDGSEELEAGRCIGVEFLRRALDGPADEGQKRDLELALGQAECVSPSPIFSGAEGLALVA